MSDDKKCEIDGCGQPLTPEETLVAAKSGFALCKRHWCPCMPESTPWSYVEVCYMCEHTTYCKSCKGSTEKCDPICSVCQRVLSKIQ